MVRGAVLQCQSGTTGTSPITALARGQCVRSCRHCGGRRRPAGGAPGNRRTRAPAVTVDRLNQDVAGTLSRPASRTCLEWPRGGSRTSGSRDLDEVRRRSALAEPRTSRVAAVAGSVGSVRETLQTRLVGPSAGLGQTKANQPKDSRKDTDAAITLAGRARPSYWRFGTTTPRRTCPG